KLAVAAAGAALVARPSSAAQQSAQERDWLALVHESHQLIELGFSKLLDAKDFTPEHSIVGLRALDYQLKAHSFAEETSIYPAMARAGMQDQAQQLYGEEAHNHVLLWPLEVQLREGQREADWKGELVALRDAVLVHAKKHEEQELFPA